MKVKDLKLDQKVDINGIEYNYKGIQKVKIPNFGKVQKIVFETKTNNKTEQKLFDLIVGNKDLKITEEVIYLK